MEITNNLKYKVTQNEILKKGMLAILLIYSLVITIACFKMTPKVTLIAIESSGTRVINSNTDKALRAEKENFLRSLIMHLYAYDAESYDSRISQAGDLMTLDLWKQKQEDFTKVSQKLKQDELSQAVKIIDIREIDLENYQAELELRINHKLQENKVKLLVDFKIVKKTSRNETNAYDLEVQNYVENTM